jgi:hypothetical protein
MSTMQPHHPDLHRSADHRPKPITCDRAFGLGHTPLVGSHLSSQLFMRHWRWVA